MLTKNISFYITLLVALLVLRPIRGEEPTANLENSAHNSWLSEHRFDKNEYIKQQARLGTVGYIEYRSQMMDAPGKFRFPTRILGLISDSVSEKRIFLDRPLTIHTDSLEGYSLDYDVTVVPHGKNFGFTDFGVVVSSNEIFNTNLQKSDKRLRGYIGCFESYDVACSNLLRRMTFGSAPLEMYYNMYKIDKGPGDACLVEVGEKRVLDNENHTSSIEFILSDKSNVRYFMNDRRVAFVRGNVAVYLQSDYKDFGCMDLACRLDAFLVEQMRKQQEEKKDEDM